MITYSNLKAYNQIWSPMGRYPMIDNTIFETYAEALAFATTNSVAVVGNIITVTSDTDSSKNGAYVLVCDGKLTNASQPTGLKKLGSDIDLSNYVTKDQISSVYTYKGSKDTFAELPVVNTIGDVWNVEEAHENHPAGTNWVWNGEAWDALAGSVDLSGYALKADVEASVKTLTDNVAANTGAIATANTALANKVDKVEGSSLISSEKLALIDTNAGAIEALGKVDEGFETRIATLESAFKGEGGEIDLGDLTAQISDHASRIGSLEGDNTTNKNNISALQTQANGYGERLTAIEGVNTEQSGQLSDLTNRVVAVEAHGTAITNLTGTVNGHTNLIAGLRTDLDKDIADLQTLSGQVNTIAGDYLKASDKTELQGNIDAKVAQSDYDAEIAELAKADTDNLKAAKDYADAEIAKLNSATVAAQVEANKTAIATLNGSDTGKSAREIVQDEVSKQLESENITESFDTLKEMAEWLSSHPQDVLEIQNAIKAISDDYLKASDKEEIQNTIVENKRVTDEALTNLDGRVNALEDKSSTIDSALQASDITTGSANGTISVKGTDVAVKGLGSAAFVESTTFAAASNTYTKAEVNALLEWEEVD